MSLLLSGGFLPDLTKLRRDNLLRAMWPGRDAVNRLLRRQTQRRPHPSMREDAGSISTKLPYRAPRLSEAYHARDRGIFLNFE
jgi:hypothetical protein